MPRPKINKDCIVCGEPAKCRSLCIRHYEQWRRTGSTEYQFNIPKNGTCSQCGKVRDKEKSPYCSDCRVDAYRASYIKSNKKKFSRLKNFLESVKLSCGCVDCGYRENVWALQFDHINGDRKFCLTSGTYLGKHIIEELEKCDVVCANCHAIRTQQRGQYSQKERI